MASAPVLSWDGGAFVLSWVWTDADPDAWLCEESADGFTGWTAAGTVGGVYRSMGFGDSMYARITGVDLLGNPVTDPSNVVYAV